MKPKTPTPAVGIGEAPIPASELVRKPAPTVRAAQPTPSKFGLTVIAGQLRGQRFRLGGAGCMVGRAKGAILFPEDPFVSPHHATFLIREGRLYVRDEASASGVFATVAQEQLQTGSCFAAGQRLFRYTGALVPPAPPPPPKPIVYGAPVPRTQTLYGVEEIIVGGRPGRAV
ncbi:MAG TPA: FHA domain-containing protein, partial [Vulgatibacter sp.]